MVKKLLQGLIEKLTGPDSAPEVPEVAGLAPGANAGAAEAESASAATLEEVQTALSEAAGKDFHETHREPHDAGELVTFTAFWTDDHIRRPLANTVIDVPAANDFMEGHANTTAHTKTHRLGQSSGGSSTVMSPVPRGVNAIVIEAPMDETQKEDLFSESRQGAHTLFRVSVTVSTGRLPLVEKVTKLGEAVLEKITELKEAAAKRSAGRMGDETIVQGPMWSSGDDGNRFGTMALENLPERQWLGRDEMVGYLNERHSAYAWEVLDQSDQAETILIEGVLKTVETSAADETYPRLPAFQDSETPKELSVRTVPNGLQIRFGFKQVGFVEDEILSAIDRAVQEHQTSLGFPDKDSAAKQRPPLNLPEGARTFQDVLAEERAKGSNKPGTPPAP